MQNKRKKYNESRKFTVRYKTKRKVDTSNKYKKPEKTTQNKLSHFTEWTIRKPDTIHSSRSLYNDKKKYSNSEVYSEIGEGYRLNGKVNSRYTVRDSSDISCYKKRHTECQYVQRNAQEWKYYVRSFHDEGEWIEGYFFPGMIIPKSVTFLIERKLL